MKIRFRIPSMSGRQVVDQFAEQVTVANKGFDPDFSNSYCKVLHDGVTWQTAWSQFTYTVLNPEANLPAMVEYKGACNGFLKQNLLPDCLRENEIELTVAVITDGSVMSAFNGYIFKDARVVSHAYALVSEFRRQYKHIDFDKFEFDIAAIEKACMMTLSPIALSEAFYTINLVIAQEIYNPTVILIVSKHYEPAISEAFIIKADTDLDQLAIRISNMIKTAS